MALKRNGMEEVFSKISNESLCKGEKLLGGPVNSTYENGVLYLECNSTTKKWSPSETVWPTDANCITSNKNCTFSNFPATPGILIG